jgi:hypothetical protein
MMCRQAPRAGGVPGLVVELAGELRAYVRDRQRQPGVVVGFFAHPATCYAAQ